MSVKCFGIDSKQTDHNRVQTALDVVVNGRSVQEVMLEHHRRGEVLVEVVHSREVSPDQCVAETEGGR